MIFNIINNNGYCGGFSDEANDSTIAVDIENVDHFLSHIGAYLINGSFDQDKWDELVAEWGEDDH